MTLTRCLISLGLSLPSVKWDGHRGAGDQGQMHKRDNNLRVSLLGERWSGGAAECCLALSLCPLTEEQGIHGVGSSA